MKKLPLILLILLSTHLLAQENNEYDIRNGLGVRFHGYSIGDGFRINFSPQFNFIHDRLLIGVGPTFLLRSAIDGIETNLPRLTGAHFSVSYLTGKKNKTFKGFFHNELVAQQIDNQWTASIWDPDNQEYQTITINDNEALISNHMGYGFSYLFSKHLGISASAGLGFFYSNTDSSTEYDLDEEIGNYRSYGSFGFTWSTTISIQYHFR